MTGTYSKFLGRRLSRRRILKGAIWMALGTAGPGLPACGGEDADPTWAL